MFIRFGVCFGFTLQFCNPDSEEKGDLKKSKIHLMLSILIKYSYCEFEITQINVITKLYYKIYTILATLTLCFSAIPFKLLNVIYALEYLY